MARADTPKSENLDDILPVPGSTRRTRDKKDKEKELREREKEKEKEKAKEVCGLSKTWFDRNKHSYPLWNILNHQIPRTNSLRDFLTDF